MVNIVDAILNEFIKAGFLLWLSKVSANEICYMKRMFPLRETLLSHR